MVNKITSPITPLGEIDKINELVDGVNNAGTVKKVNNTSPDNNGNVTISIPSAVTESTVSGWGFTKNAGTVTSVNNISPTNGNVTLSIPAAQVQSNWNETSTSSKAYIQNKPTIPTVNNATLTITQGGTTKGTFTANASSDVTIALDAGGSGTTEYVRNIGEIVTSTIPLTDAGLHLLDGALISSSGIYGDFVTYISGLVSNYPDLFVSESDWQTSVTNYGTCGHFVYKEPTQYQCYASVVSGVNIKIYIISGDYSTIYGKNNDGTFSEIIGAYFTDTTSTIKTVYYPDLQGEIQVMRAPSWDEAPTFVRLPKITGFTEGTIDTTTLGDLTEAGLPNITGFIGCIHDISAKTGGAFSYTKTGNSGGGIDTTDSTNGKIHFNASRSAATATQANGIYRDNCYTVQPQTIKVLYYIVVATTTKTEIEVDIDNIATELNTCLDTKRYDGQWVSSFLSIASSVTWKTNTAVATYSLANYLPNDNYNYEVLIIGTAATGSTSGNFVTIGLNSDLIDNGEIIAICESRTRTAAQIESRGNAIIPVGTGRWIKQYSSSSNNANGTYSLWALAYRRIGTNS